MATIKENFALAISKGLDAADLITDNKDKAMAYAAIASALAHTGAINNMKSTSIERTEVEADHDSEAMGSEDKPIVAAHQSKAKATKEDLKRKPAKKEAKHAEKAKEEVAEPVKEEAPAEVADEEWQPKTADWDDDNAAEHLAPELNFIEEKIEEYGEDGINECVSEYTHGKYNNYGDLNPLNIRAFVAYIKDCEAADDDESAS